MHGKLEKETKSDGEKSLHLWECRFKVFVKKAKRLPAHIFIDRPHHIISLRPRYYISERVPTRSRCGMNLRDLDRAAQPVDSPFKKRVLCEYSF